MLSYGVHMRTVGMWGLSHSRAFSLTSLDSGLTWCHIIWREWWGSLAMSRCFDASHLLVLCINFVIRQGQSGNIISFLLAMLCHLGVLGLEPMTIFLGFTRFPIPMSFCQRRENHHMVCTFNAHQSTTMGWESIIRQYTRWRLLLSSNANCILLIFSLNCY